MSFEDQKLCIAAVGFDALGYKARPKTHETDDYRIEFITKAEALNSQLDYKGYIIPSGIFERFVNTPDKDGMRTEIRSDYDQMDQIEKKLLESLSENAWVCFLLDEVIDRINEEHPKVRTSVVNDTDLAKRFLNRFQVGRTTVNEVQNVEVKAPSFMTYAERYAHIKTVINPSEEISFRELVSSSHGMAGVCISENVFFLPFFQGYKTSNPVIDPIESIVLSIIELSSSPSMELPDWVNDFEFEQESLLSRESRKLKVQLQGIQTNLSKIKSWKAVLSSSGQNLRNINMDILESFFSLTVRNARESSEAFELVGPDNERVAFCRSLSLPADLKRKYINQMDNYREAQSMDPETPGLLLLNDHTQLNKLDHKTGTDIPDSMVDLARFQNILIIRSMDLLFLMKQWEPLDETTRYRSFLELLKKGGGRLQADQTSHLILDSRGKVA